MAWTNPTLRSTGDVITASIWNVDNYYNPRFLRGLDGVVTIDSGLIIDNTGGDEYLQIPSLTTAERDALTPVNGMVIYNETTTEFNKYENGGWVDLADATDHGGLDGLTDDDHTQYQKENLLTTQGDIVYASGASTWARLAKGTAGHYLKQGASIPEWVAGTGTFEFFMHFLYEGTGTVTTLGDFGVIELDATQLCRTNFKVPHDFASLTHCKVAGVHNISENIDWTATTDWGAVGETYNTDSDSATADGVAMTANATVEIDISAAFTGIAADDYVGLTFTLDTAAAGVFRLYGLVFKYST